MNQENGSNSEDDSECVQRKRLKRMEARLNGIEQRLESLERASADKKK